MRPRRGGESKRPEKHCIKNSIAVETCPARLRPCGFMAKRYIVYVDDNFHYMDESERYKYGEFDDCNSDVAACKRIVDEFLSTCDVTAGAEEMYKHYISFGEDPWISSDDSDCKFSAWDYAKERCRELAKKEGP